MKLAIIMATLALGITASAQNALSLLKSSATYDRGEFQVYVKGNTVEFRDVKNSVTYALNTDARTAKQAFPDAFLRMSRARGASAGVAGLVRSISVSDIWMSGVTQRKDSFRQVKEGSLGGNITVELGYSSPFGNLSATVVMAARADLTHEERYGSFMVSPGKWESKVGLGTSIRGSAGDFLRLTKFESNLPTALNNIVGMLIDVGIRIGSLGLRSTETIYQDM